MTAIAVIPARGGSKRIPRKNIRAFAGQPMIAHAIAAAQRSALFSHVIVSTDDEDIAQVARDHGANVPFIRPPELSNDYAGTTEVIAHAAAWAMDNGLAAETVCCIYATSPFIEIDDLVRSAQILRDGQWDFVFPATEFAAPIFRSFRQRPEGGLEMFFPEHFTTRSQDLPVALHDAGQFYFGTGDAWLQRRPIFGQRSQALQIPTWRVVDIDTPDDWTRAELTWKALRGAALQG